MFSENVKFSNDINLVGLNEFPNNVIHTIGWINAEKINAGTLYHFSNSRFTSTYVSVIIYLDFHNLCIAELSLKPVPVSRIDFPVYSKNTSSKDGLERDTVFTLILFTL